MTRLDAPISRPDSHVVNNALQNELQAGDRRHSGLSCTAAARMGRIIALICLALGSVLPLAHGQRSCKKYFDAVGISEALRK